MTITEEIQEKLFYKLEPEGCWHRPDVPFGQDKGAAAGPKICRGCLELWSNNLYLKLPNLANPSWPDFGWMITRAKKAEWWRGFKTWAMDVEITTEWGATNMISVIPDFLFDPTTFRDALINYFGLGGEE